MTQSIFKLIFILLAWNIGFISQAHAEEKRFTLVLHDGTLQQIDLSGIGNPVIKLGPWDKMSLYRVFQTLPKGFKISHIYVQSHGRSSLDGKNTLINVVPNEYRVILATDGQPQTQHEVITPFGTAKNVTVNSKMDHILTQTDELDKNAFDIIGPHLADNAKIFFYTCYLFYGTHEEVATKSDLIRKLFNAGDKDITIYGFSHLAAFPMQYTLQWLIIFSEFCANLVLYILDSRNKRLWNSSE